MKKHSTCSTLFATLTLCAALFTLPVSAMADDPADVFRPEALRNDGPVVEVASAVGGVTGGAVGIVAGTVIGAPVGAVVGTLVTGKPREGLTQGFWVPVNGLAHVGAYVIGGPVWLVKKIVYDAPREVFRAATAG